MSARMDSPSSKQSSFALALSEVSYCATAFVHTDNCVGSLFYGTYSIILFNSH